MSDKPFDYWTFFIEDAKKIGSPLYARLADGVRSDADLKALAERARKGQPPANMILGAVHFLLLRGAEHPLRKHYPDLGGGAPEGEDPFPLFRDFVNLHRDAITKLIETRVTNTNEVGRSTVLHAGFRNLAAQVDAPLHLVEIGPSAGLNMIWDRYGVRYIKDGAVAASVGPDAKLVIDCEKRGDHVPPAGNNPAVAGRVGLELNPVDLSNADDRDWLRALMWAGSGLAPASSGTRDGIVLAGKAPHRQRRCPRASAGNASTDSARTDGLCLSHHRRLSVQHGDESSA